MQFIAYIFFSIFFGFTEGTYPCGNNPIFYSGIKYKHIINNMLNPDSSSDCIGYRDKIYYLILICILAVYPIKYLLFIGEIIHP